MSEKYLKFVYKVLILLFLELFEFFFLEFLLFLIKEIFDNDFLDLNV